MATARVPEINLAQYEETGCVFLPGFFNAEEVKAIQEWTDQLVDLGADVVYEKGHVTRCENFVHLHRGFDEITNTSSRLAKTCSALFNGDSVALFKEKLNFKPPGGAGFMPHLDHPSLAFYAPPTVTSFVTVMVAIDAMSRQNGCLRLARGRWSASTAPPCIAPEGDPEVGGRAGALVDGDSLEYWDCECEAGDVLMFHGHVPHRSGANGTNERRRAVFFTYNALKEGSWRTQYYAELAKKRDEWKKKLADEMYWDYDNDARAMATVPSGAFDVRKYLAAPGASAVYRREESDDEPSSETEQVVGALF